MATNRYFYKGKDIANLTGGTGGTMNTGSYLGFPTQNTVGTFSSNINKPFNFSFTDTGGDLASRCNAYFIGYGPNSNTKGSTTTSAQQSLNINYIQFKHISAYAWGGGGGGGGANTYHLNQKNGGTGSRGDDGGYAAAVQVAVSNENAFVVQYGGGGNGGNAGGKTASQNTGAGDGVDGGAGGNSYIQLHPSQTTIIQANGGNGGEGGNGGNVGSGGSGGSAGNNGTGVSAVGNSYVTTDQTTNTDWPARNTGNYGGGGTWASWNGPSASAGISGNAGYVGIYFLYL